MQGPDKKKLETVFLAANYITECISKKVQDNFGECGESNLVISVNIDEDWPYTITVDVKADTRYCKPTFLRDVLEQILDSCFEEAVNYLKKERIEALP